MTDPQELARRYLALWEEYLAALLSDPSATQLWSSLAGDRRPSDTESEPGSQPGSPPGSAAAAGASDKRSRAVAELARRVAVLENRIAALERDRPAVARSRRRNRRVRV
jgi:hypothetical protein